jgi:hypothetical protein
MTDQKDLCHSPQSEREPERGHSDAEQAERRRKHDPHIPLMTDLYMHGAALIGYEGMIKGLLIGARTYQDNEAAAQLIKLHVLPDVKREIDKLCAAVAEYEQRTFKAPAVTAEEYEALVGRENRKATG